ncbi:hypothetical protein [Ottowia sp.]|uniref:hypothetical protein n=1 Tax=Ottowia sp. TaxID=1898956 RepID=UPI003A886A8A
MNTSNEEERPSLQTERQARLQRERQRLQAKRNRMPIIDVTRDPLEKLSGRWQQRALPYFLWFRFGRPVLLCAAWAAALVYAWKNLQIFSEDPTALSELGLYGVIVLIVMLLVIAYAQARGKAPPRKFRPPETTSVREVADFAELPTRYLSAWQDLPLVTVEHDAQGRVRDAHTVSPGQTRPAPLEIPTSPDIESAVADSRSLKRKPRSPT